MRVVSELFHVVAKRQRGGEVFMPLKKGREETGTEANVRVWKGCYELLFTKC